MITVTLTEGELAVAEAVGRLRNDDSRKKGRQHGHSLKPDDGKGLKLDIEGAASEMSFAKFLGRFWSPFHPEIRDLTEISYDVGEYQVRSTTNVDGRLVINTHRDRESDIFVLVINRSPEFDIVGWCMGHEGMQEKFLQSYNGRDPSYFVPRTLLRNVELLT